MLTKERKRQKQLSRGALRKGRFKNTQQTHRRTPTPKHDLNKTASQLHETMPRHGRPRKSNAYLQNTPHKNTSRRLLLKREREVSKSIYTKFYIKVYENLLGWNIVYIFIKIINSQDLYVRCMKYLVNRPIFHKFYVQSTIIKPCGMYFTRTFQLTTFYRPTDDSHCTCFHSQITFPKILIE